MYVGAAAAVVGGVASAYGASQAADSQSEASGKAAKAQLEMFNKARADLAPWTTTGKEALNALWKKTQAGPGELETSPGYQFRLSEGQKGIERAQSARGGLGSGAFAKDMANYNQGMASNEYQNFLNNYYQSLQPYQNLATMGQASAAQQAAGALSTGQGLANSAMASGAAQAGGYINSANAITGGIQSGINNYLAYKYLNNQNAATPSTVGTDSTNYVASPIQHGINYDPKLQFIPSYGN
jgi:hypothetical protein